MSMPTGHAAQIVRGNVSNALLEAALLLGIGFYLRYIGLQGISPSRLYNFSVDAAIWTFLIGGVLIAIVALLCLTGRPWALLADCVAGSLIGASILACGAVWLFHSDIQGIILILVGLFDLNSARGSWGNYQLALRAVTTAPVTGFPAMSAADDTQTGMPDSQAKAEAMERLLSTKQARPAVPAKVDVSRKDEPVPDGFLAELGRRPDSQPQPHQNTDQAGV